MFNLFYNHNQCHQYNQHPIYRRRYTSNHRYGLDYAANSNSHCCLARYRYGRSQHLYANLHRWNFDRLWNGKSRSRWQCSSTRTMVSRCPGDRSNLHNKQANIWLSQRSVECECIGQRYISHLHKHLHWFQHIFNLHISAKWQYP